MGLARADRLARIRSIASPADVSKRPHNNTTDNTIRKRLYVGGAEVNHLACHS